MPEEAQDSEFTLMPPGTVVFEPFQGHVTLLFPTDDDAISFYQFLKSFVNGEIDLFAQEGKSV